MILQEKPSRLQIQLLVDEYKRQCSVLRGALRFYAEVQDATEWLKRMKKDRGLVARVGLEKSKWKK